MNERPRKLSESAIGFGSAVVTFFVPHFLDWVGAGGGFMAEHFISDRRLASAMAFGLAAGGVLLHRNRQMIEASRVVDLEDVRQLAQLGALTAEHRSASLVELNKIYTSIEADVFQPAKQEILAAAIADLAPIASTARTNPMQAAVFTKAEADRMRSGAQPGQAVRSLATLFEGDLDPIQTAEEAGFIATNVALAQECDFERLFLLNSADYQAAIDRPSVKLHIGPNSKLAGLVVFRETLQQRDPALLRDVGDGFLLFQGEIAFVDTAAKDAEIRGYISINTQEVAFLSTLYERLRVYAHELSATHHPLTRSKL